MGRQCRTQIGLSSALRVDTGEPVVVRYVNRPVGRSVLSIESLDELAGPPGGPRRPRASANPPGALPEPPPRRTTKVAMSQLIPPSPINDEAIDRLRNRVAIPVKWGEGCRNTVSTIDSIQQYANGYGDDNPLYCSTLYGAATRWGSILAPPLYFLSTGSGGRPVEWTPEQEAAMSGGDPLRGVGQVLTGERWAFVRPIVPGVELRKKRFLHAVDVRESSFGGGRVVMQTMRVVYFDDADHLYAVNDRTYDYADRAKSGSTGKYRDIQIPPYTDEQMEEIESAYDAEWRRGADPLRASDVTVGHELPTIVKGPLTLTDILCYHIGTGWGGSAGPLKLAYQTRKRRPGFYTRNSLNVPDVAQRCHWEAEYAQQLGHPAAYDYGAMRTNWMVHLVTNWMGDDAWISRLSTEARRFNYIGDTQWIRGRVTDVRSDVPPACVDVEMEGTNQRGEVTCRGNASVLLSSANGDAPDLPDLAIDDIPARL